MPTCPECESALITISGNIINGFVFECVGCECQFVLLGVNEIWSKIKNGKGKHHIKEE